MGEREDRRASEAAAALAAAERWQLSGGRPDLVLVVATGAARALGEALGALATVPVVATSDVVPGYLGPGSLVLALERAHELVADRLLEVAAARGARVVRIGPARTDPARTDPARTGRTGLLEEVVLAPASGSVAISSLAAAALGVAERAGVTSAPAPAGELVEGVRAGAARSDVAELARKIDRTFAYLWGAEGLAAAAARCWQAELAQRTKTPSFTARLPGATYVELAAFGLSGDVTRQLLTLVELRLPGDPPARRARTDAGIELLRETLASVLAVEFGGEPAAGFGEALALGEALAVALAAHEGVDPDSVAIADDLERALRG